MLSIPPMLGPVAAVVGALAAWTGVIVTVLIFLWNKLDKRFDELKAEMRENRAEVRAEMQEHRAEVRAEMQEHRAEMRALREVVLSVLSVKA